MGIYAIRAGLGGVLLYAALPKLWNPYGFLHSVRAYDLVVDPIAVALSAILPSLELVLAICLVLNMYSAAASLIGVFLFGTFGIAEFSALARGLDISCGCFATDESGSLSYTSFLVVLGLALLSAFSFWGDGARHGSRPTSSDPVVLD